MPAQTLPRARAKICWPSRCHQLPGQVRFALNFKPERFRGPMIKTVEWTKEGVSMLDQRLLPTEEKYLMLRSWEEVAEAIKKMVVRGAPAIGVSAAMGLALGASQSVGMSVADLEDDFTYMCQVMGETRPTAVNLFWAIERMRDRFNREKGNTKSVEEIKASLVAEAQKIFQE